ncbi:MAG: hypothetical protein RID09_12925 [Coleofasciculus sp. G1-WW12-02]
MDLLTHGRSLSRLIKDDHRSLLADRGKTDNGLRLSLPQPSHLFEH